MDLSKKINEVATALKAEILAGNFTVVKMDLELDYPSVVRILIAEKHELCLFSDKSFMDWILKAERGFTKSESIDFCHLLKLKERAYKDSLIKEKLNEIEALKAK
ncbi:hypothetical protein AUW17_05260 [Tenacibaculum dicentrarchi]|nr:hypothetical protein AUW17_03125 [Tenacibaculum dicentrarchi]ALU74712.1 hypothetical protein AUW17_05260 [Tenacibaculum dicentrarchi]